MQIEKSSVQDNQKAVTEVLHRLPAAVATNVIASLSKRHFLAAGALGFAAGTGLQVVTRGLAAYHRGDDLTSLNTWLPILETSALDSARTLICLGIGSVGRRLLPNAAIARNFLVNEVVGFSYCRLDLLLYGQTDLAGSDAIIWGISGFVGGAASLLFKNKALAEFGFEYGREVIEELSQTYVKHGKITTAEAIMTTGMAMQEGGSKGTHLVQGSIQETSRFVSLIKVQVRTELVNRVSQELLIRDFESRETAFINLHERLDNKKFTQAERIKLAKIAAAQNGMWTSRYIQNYDITDEGARVTIAKIAAAQDSEGTSRYTQNYGITNRKALIKIAKIAAAKN